MSVFTPSPSDLSVQILNKIFGVGWQNLFTSHQLAGHAGVLASMFQIFNTVILAGVTAFFTYVMVTGVIGSAHEGQVGGRRLHNFWVPFRGVTSVGLLAPLPWAKGFCLIQA
ncbi:MAG TPA: conjugal transfer protein TraY, partial [Gammaproteobacteria bacterium]|nr:conjugal transfer protein TraY [Gammaproteobacteria bacterium]